MLGTNLSKLCGGTAVAVLLLGTGSFCVSNVASAKLAVHHDSATDEEPATVYLRFRLVKPADLEKAFPDYANRLQQVDCLLEIDAIELSYLFNLMDDKRISAAGAPLECTSGILKQVTLYSGDHANIVHAFELCATTSPNGVNLCINQSKPCVLLRDGGCIASIPQPEGTAYLLITGG